MGGIGVVNPPPPFTVFYMKIASYYPNFLRPLKTKVKPPNLKIKNLGLKLNVSLILKKLRTKKSFKNTFLIINVYFFWQDCFFEHLF